MTRSMQITPAVVANCASSSSDSSTGQSLLGMSTPTRIARLGARANRVLDRFSSITIGIECSCIQCSLHVIVCYEKGQFNWERICAVYCIRKEEASERRVGDKVVSVDFIAHCRQQRKAFFTKYPSAKHQMIPLIQVAS